MPLDRVQVIVEHLIMDGSREGLILGDELNVAMGASARRRAAREAEEGPTYHGIVRYTHVRCGYTTRVRSEMEILNDGDPACPACSEKCNPEDCSPWPCRWPYGEMVWENSDGTMVETYHVGQELTRWQPVRTHVQIYKSWVNGPEWWVVPRPNTGDLDDNLIVGFDTYQEALDAVTSGEMPALLSELCPANDGIAWRDRNDPIYQTTTPKEGLRF